MLRSKLGKRAKAAFYSGLIAASLVVSIAGSTTSVGATSTSLLGPTGQGAVIPGEIKITQHLKNDTKTVTPTYSDGTISYLGSGTPMTYELNPDENMYTFFVITDVGDSDATGSWTTNGLYLRGSVDVNSKNNTVLVEAIQFDGTNHTKVREVSVAEGATVDMEFGTTSTIKPPGSSVIPTTIPNTITLRNPNGYQLLMENTAYMRYAWATDLNTSTLGRYTGEFVHYIIPIQTVHYTDYYLIKSDGSKELLFTEEAEGGKIGESYEIVRNTSFDSRYIYDASLTENETGILGAHYEVGTKLIDYWIYQRNLTTWQPTTRRIVRYRTIVKEDGSVKISLVEEIDGNEQEVLHPTTEAQENEILAPGEWSTLGSEEFQGHQGGGHYYGGNSGTGKYDYMALLVEEDGDPVVGTHFGLNNDLAAADSRSAVYYRERIRVPGTPSTPSTPTPSEPTSPKTGEYCDDAFKALITDVYFKLVELFN